MFIEGNHIFGVLKQNLEVNQRVIIGSTSDSNLEGQTGVILGKTFDDIFDSYIILLEKPYNGQKAINLTEACISRI